MSTGGSGNVTIHSADSETFGERKTTIPSGRNKFGMYTKHVDSFLPSRNMLYSRANLLYSVQMDQKLLYHQKQVKYTYLTLNQTP